jgi:exportin-2 (importin alpha re-exporter)
MLGISIRLESYQGVSELNSNVNLMEFFSSQVFPELQDTNHANRPMVKATALKFICTFRKQFSKPDLLSLMPLLIAHLSSSSVVVHTLAAYAIERSLMIIEEAPNGVKHYKIKQEDLTPLLQNLFTGLFAIIDNAEWNENEHVMKCTMRALSRAGRDVIPVTDIVFEKLSSALGRVCKNPRNPSYNHYLFESIAALVRNCCSQDASMTAKLEALLFPPFQTVLQMEILEFTPYVFQVLAQLLEFRPEGSGLGEAYTSLFPPLLNAQLWEKKGNVPGLVRLVSAYIKRSANEPLLLDQLTPMLGIFQRLHASSSTEASSFELLRALTTYVKMESMQPAMPTILRLILTKLQTAKTQKYAPLAISYFAVITGLYGGQAFLDSINQVQQGLGLSVLVGVWVPKLTLVIQNKVEAKIQVVGLSRLLCDTPALLDDENCKQIWAQAFKGVVGILTSQSFTSRDIEDNEADAEIGYDATFTKLSLAAKKPDDPFASVADPVAAFTQALQTLSSQRPGVLGPIIQASLNDDPKLASGFQGMVHQSGATIA